MSKIQKSITKASDLILEDKKEEAKLLLNELLQKYPMNKKVYANAVNIFLEGEMLSETKEVFHLYCKQTGKHLVTDFTLEEIEKEEQENKMAVNKYQRKERKTFRRLSIKERGHFSNYFSLFPIKKIEINNNGIILKKGDKTYHYQWSDIVDAIIIRRIAHKDYGGGIGSDFLQKLMVLRTRNETFKFDVSANFPDFKHSDILVSELRKHLDIKETDIKKRNKLYEWLIYAILIIFFLALLLLKWCS